MYSTVKQVVDALAPGVRPNGTAADSIADTQIRDAIAEADSRIDLYIGARYTVEVANPNETDLDLQHAVPPVNHWSRDIAAYLITLTYKRNQPIDDNDPVRLRYQDVMSALRAVQAGSMTLNLPRVGSDSPTVVTVVNQYSGNLFGPADFDLSAAPAYDRYRSVWGY